VHLSATTRLRAWLGPAVLLLAAACYLHGLGAIDLPSIGDEPLYLQIARVTAESDHWLPLRAESGVLDTKPPLLFWMGRLAASGEGGWTLWRLRLPVVLLTFATAGVAGVLAARLSRSAGAGWLAALIFLGFRGTIQHGRPFLTNAGEVLFLAAPLLLLVRRHPSGAGLALPAGLSLGVAALFKSFAVVVPGAAALALLLARREGAPVVALRRHGAAVAVAALLGLAIFSLWPLLDPRPDLIWSQFVRGENAGKLDLARFLPGLLVGPYPLWRIWLGPLLNAGLLAPPLLALGLDAWRRRRALPLEEAELWWWSLGFLVFYSIPTQRQENYVLPVGVALAALLAHRWKALPTWSVRAPLLLLGLVALALTPALLALPAAPGADRLHPAWLLAAAPALGIAALAGAWRLTLGSRLLPVLAVLALPLVSGVLAPFAGPFPPEAIAEVAGRPVGAPDRFAQDQELLRFRLPGASLTRYSCPVGPLPCRPPSPAGHHVLAFLELDDPAPAGYQVSAELPHLKARHSPAEMARLLGGDVHLLLERLVLLRAAGGAGHDRSQGGALESSR
jgi:4-amino-4-deoxy-L-arabinose transferase-like glycosyltransferase